MLVVSMDLSGVGWASFVGRPRDGTDTDINTKYDYTFVHCECTCNACVWVYVSCACVHISICLYVWMDSNETGSWSPPVRVRGEAIACKAGSDFRDPAPSKAKVTAPPPGHSHGLQHTAHLSPHPLPCPQNPPSKLYAYASRSLSFWIFVYVCLWLWLWCVCARAGGVVEKGVHVLKRGVPRLPHGGIVCGASEH